MTSEKLTNAELAEKHLHANFQS